VVISVVIVCPVAAGACFLYAFLERRSAARTPGRRAESTSRYQIAVLVIALGFALVAAATATVGEKVGSKHAGRPVRGSALDYRVGASDLANFTGPIAVGYRPTATPRCLVNYFDGSQPLGSRSYKYWTSCDENAKFKTITDVQNGLALLPDWGPRNARVIACVPAGASLPYLRGQAAPKWSEEAGRQYYGRDLQFRVLSFNKDWIVQRQAVAPTPSSLPVLDRGRCRR